MEVVSDEETENRKVEEDYLKTMLEVEELMKKCEIEVYDKEINEPINNSINYPPISLHKDINYHSQQYDNGRVYICLYQINNFCKFPFLQYFLLKYSESHPHYSDLLVFPNFEYICGEDVFTHGKVILDFICLCYKSNMTYTYKGFINNDNVFYMMFDFSESAISSYLLRKNDDLWLVGMDEIINYKSVMNYNIDEAVVNFFLDNEKLLHIENNIGEKYETPMILYSYCPNKMLDYCISVGTPKSEEHILLGPYYYFIPFKNIKDIYDIMKEGNKGIIRNAVFTGKVCLNKTMSPDIKNNTCDVFGRYDSLCVNNSNMIYWVVNEYSNHVPISGHPDIFNSNEEKEK